MWSCIHQPPQSWYPMKRFLCTYQHVIRYLRSNISAGKYPQFVVGKHYMCCLSLSAYSTIEPISFFILLTLLSFTRYSFRFEKSACMLRSLSRCHHPKSIMLTLFLSVVPWALFGNTTIASSCTISPFTVNTAAKIVPAGDACKIALR